MPEFVSDADLIPGSREWYAARLYGGSTAPNADQARANRNTLATEIGYITPGIGEAMSGRDAWDASGEGARALTEGRYGDAAGSYGNMLAAMLGAIPGLGIIARGTRRGRAAMDNTLPASVNRALDSAMPSDPKNTTFSGVGSNRNQSVDPFQAWFGQSKVVDETGQPLRVYHGTQSDFDTFDRIDGGNAYGPGYYFTKDPQKASDYALGENVTRMTTGGNAGPNVMPVHLRMEKPFAMKGVLSRKDLDRIEAEINRLRPDDPYYQKGELAAFFDRAYPPTGQNVWQNLPDFGRSQVVRAAGFDGLDTDYGLVVFEPTQIKSAIGNRGTYSRTNPSLTNSLPFIAGGAMAAPYLMSDEE